MNTYDDFDPTGCLMSEKFDGVCGIWDGAELTTRSGNVIDAPQWFLDSLPAVALVGELWLGLDLFDDTSVTVRRGQADARWNEMRFRIFDAPDGFQSESAHVSLVEQVRCESMEHMRSRFQQIIDAGGEGIVITNTTGERFKLKQSRDSEGVLVGISDGKGRNAGRVGAFLLQLRDGNTFKLGVGLPDEVRSEPPAIGSVIRFTYERLTHNGIPRFARFDGVRAETSLAMMPVA